MSDDGGRLPARELVLQVRDTGAPEAAPQPPQEKPKVEEKIEEQVDVPQAPVPPPR